MPKLKNYKHELFCKNYVKEKGNGKQAYSNTYPNAQPVSSEVCASQLLRKPKIHQRIAEITLDSELAPETLMNSLKNEINATKVLYVDPSKKKVIVADNKTRLETKKFLLKVHGFGKDDVNIDQRSVHFTLNTPKIDQLQSLLHDMKALNAQVEDNGQDGEVL